MRTVFAALALVAGAFTVTVTAGTPAVAQPAASDRCIDYNEIFRCPQ